MSTEPSATSVGANHHGDVDRAFGAAPCGERGVRITFIATVLRGGREADAALAGELAAMGLL
jgi:hypothetical protein